MRSPGSLDRVAPMPGVRTDSQPLAKLWLATGVVSASGSWLAFDALPGINWVIWTVVAAGGFVVFQRLGGKIVTWDRLALLALACLLAGGASFTANPVFYALIVISVVVIAATATLIAGGTPAHSVDGVVIALAPVVVGFRAVGEAAKRAGEAVRSLSAERSLPVLRAGAIATPVIVVFALLLSGADPTLAVWRDGVARALAQLSFIPRTIFFGVLGVGVLGAYGIALRPAGEGNPPFATPIRLRRAVLTDVERLIVLGSVAALFALFFVLQISYLFGNAGARVGSGVTFAEAVHRGFGELTACATLVALLMIVLDRFAERGRRERLVRAVSVAIVVETQLLLLSAYHRVDLYEAAYGFTTHRLYVQVYCAVVALAMAMLGWELWTTINLAPLTRRVAVAGAVAVAGLSYWNHAAWIARHNVDRYVETGKIDLVYLTRGLAPDAIPEVARSLGRMKPDDAAWARQCLRRLYRGQVRSLDPNRRAWFEWNHRRAAIRPALLAAGVIGATEPVASMGEPGSCRER